MPDLTSIPCTYSIGDTVEWTETLADYTAGAGVAVKYFFAGGEPFNQFQISGDGSGTDWTFDMPTAKNFGRYAWQKKGTTAGVTLELDTGFITFEPNLSTEIEETAAQAQLTLAEAALSTIVTNPMQSASINGESYTYKDEAKLREFIVQLKAQVIREREKYLAALGLARNRNIQVTFVPRGGGYPRYCGGY